MKATGLVRKVDELGRIVLPMELRRSYHINCKDPIEIYTDNDCIILKKRSKSCFLCDEISQDNLVEVEEDKYLCKRCINKLSKEV
ncbi:MAG: AbrB/MazE/SpoVT family DNA-binding domain-containing protein [Ruminococcus sp.]|nr:AbrB/MazE/SpoVT family DNA-binding domain-containing protein [Ruminococcus sp.]